MEPELAFVLSFFFGLMSKSVRINNFFKGEVMFSAVLRSSIHCNLVNLSAIQLSAVNFSVVKASTMIDSAVNCNTIPCGVV